MIPVVNPTLKDTVVERLTEAILTGRVHPGERLNESYLARELHVSRAPIREALQQLQEQGLVVNRPRRGMFVVHLDEDEIDKINSVRLVLEAQALRLARAHLKPRDAGKLMQALEKLESSESAPAPVRVRLDFDFHRAMWSLSGNEYLEKTLTGLTGPVFAHNALRFVKTEKARVMLFSHRPLLEYILGNPTSRWRRWWRIICGPVSRVRGSSKRRPRQPPSRNRPRRIRNGKRA